MNYSAHTRSVIASISAAAIVVIFSGPLIQLFNYALHSELDSYVVLVPFVCGYLLWVERSNLVNRWQPAPWAAVGLALAAVFTWTMAIVYRPTHLMPHQSDRLTLFTLSFVFFVWAWGFLFLGRDWMRSAAFPMFFLIFMAPPPSALTDALETASKIASADAANMFFMITGMPTLRTGNVFQLPGITIEVAQECSGIRSSYVLILTSLVAGQLFLTRAWSRILLVFVAIPLGIIRNGFRVWTIATLSSNYGPQIIHSAIHRRGGPLFFTLSLIPLFLLVWWLHRVERKRAFNRGSGRSESRSTPAIRAVAASQIREDTRNM